MNKFALVLIGGVFAAAWATPQAQTAADGSVQVDPPADSMPRTPQAMMERMQEMRRQHEARMQERQNAMPMMMPHARMMDPQRIQQMRKQQVQMMQSRPGALPRAADPAAAPYAYMPGQAATPQGSGVEQGMEPMAAGMRHDCAERHAGMHGGGQHQQHGKKGMRHEMMQAMRGHMQAMEKRMANIEDLLRQLVELQKAK